MGDANNDASGAEPLAFLYLDDQLSLPVSMMPYEYFTQRFRHSLFNDLLSHRITLAERKIFEVGNFNGVCDGRICLRPNLLNEPKVLFRRPELTRVHGLLRFLPKQGHYEMKQANGMGRITPRKNVGELPVK
jgi:hypothetical protein